MDIQKVLELHKKWLNSENGGERANLRGADLRDADLRGAILRGAILSYVNLRGADLRDADLSYADLSGADLSGANLRGADLRDANLSYANLRGADLRDADIDYSSYPISCKGLHWHIDDKQGIQFLYHAISNILYSKNTSDELKKSVSVLVDVCNKFHRVDECGLLEGVQ